MNIKTILLLLFVTLGALAQNPVGIGVVRIDYDAASVLDLYEAPTDKKPAKTITFTKDENGWHLKDADVHTEWLDPEYLADGEHWFAFRCLANTNRWYKVTANKQTGKAYYIKQSVLTEYWTWQDYFTYMYRVYASVEIKQAPDANAPTIAYDGDGCFKARSIMGNWLEIYTEEGCDGPELKSGWVLWHTNGEPNILYAPK